MILFSNLFKAICQRNNGGDANTAGDQDIFVRFFIQIKVVFRTNNLEAVTRL